MVERRDLNYVPDRKAHDEDVVLGEVVVDAVRALEGKPAMAVPARRRRTTTTVRRNTLVLPEEADWIKEQADRRKTTPSALIRRALEAIPDVHDAMSDCLGAIPVSNAGGAGRWVTAWISLGCRRRSTVCWPGWKPTTGVRPDPVQVTIRFKDADRQRELA